MMSQLGPNRALGILLAAAMGVSYAATLTLLPNLLRLLEGRDAPSG